MVGWYRPGRISRLSVNKMSKPETSLKANLHDTTFTSCKRVLKQTLKAVQHCDRRKYADVAYCGLHDQNKIRK